MKALFQPFVSMVHALGLTHPATITKENGDGTVNLVAHDGHDTPHENVPLLAADAQPNPAGFFAVAEPELTTEEKQVVQDEADATKREEAAAADETEPGNA